MAPILPSAPLSAPALWGDPVPLFLLLLVVTDSLGHRTVVASACPLQCHNRCPSATIFSEVPSACDREGGLWGDTDTLRLLETTCLGSDGHVNGLPGFPGIQGKDHN